MSLAGRDGELERAVLPAGHVACEPADDGLGGLDAMNWMLGPGQRAAGPLLGDLAADQHAAGELDVELLPDGPLGPGELGLRGQIGLAVGGEGLTRK